MQTYEEQKAFFDSHWGALREALRLVYEEGLENVFVRHAEAANMLWEGLANLDMTPLIPAAAIALLTVAVNFVVDWMLFRSSGLKEV